MLSFDGLFENIYDTLSNAAQYHSGIHPIPAKRVYMAYGPNYRISDNDTDENRIKYQEIQLNRPMSSLEKMKFTTRARMGDEKYKQAQEYIYGRSDP